jgi:predicted ATPase
LRARSLPYGENAPYGAFAGIVREAAGVLDGDDAAVAADKLQHRLGGLSWRGTLAATDALMVLIGRGSGDLDNRAVLFDAACRFVEALGQEKPTVLGFEDLHWADTSLLDLVEHLAARVRGVPVLILATARPELLYERRSFGGGLTAYVSLSLDALSDASAEELAGELLKGRAVAPALLERIGDAGGGNPLFIEELTSSVAEGTTDPTATLPTSVISIIAARLDGLPTRERRLLLDASVIGRTFSRDLLARLDPNVNIEDALEVLEDRDFIHREENPILHGSDDTYSFRHMSLREVAYNTLPKAERRERHAEVALLIEANTPNVPTTLTPLLAYHWNAAGNPERAVDYYLLAAEQADQAWAKDEAVKLYSQALELLPTGDSRRRTISLRRAVARQAIVHIRYGDVPAPSTGAT